MAGGKNDLFVSSCSEVQEDILVMYVIITNDIKFYVLGDRKEEAIVFLGGGGIEKKLCVWGIKKVRVNRENRY